MVPHDMRVVRAVATIHPIGGTAADRRTPRRSDPLANNFKPPNEAVPPHHHALSVEPRCGPDGLWRLVLDGTGSDGVLDGDSRADGSELRRCCRGSDRTARVTGGVSGHGRSRQRCEHIATEDHRHKNGEPGEVRRGYDPARIELGTRDHEYRQGDDTDDQLRNRAFARR